MPMRAALIRGVLALAAANLSPAGASGPSALTSTSPNPSALRVQPVAGGLEHPWALAFLPEGGYLVTERPGRMRVIDAQGRMGEPLGGLPEVAARGQGGLLDVALDNGFERNRTLYFCFSEPAQGGTNSTALARARLPAGGARGEVVGVILNQQPRGASPLHFGCRIVQMPDGHL
ncbi:MAG: PQQ-dependent sugar dehydrogenase, partial [Ramlibacter sp.]